MHWWNAVEAEGAELSGWGYGERVRDIDEFYARFAGQVAALTDNPNMFGYCYTQLTDVFQEQNGLYNFDRSQKFDMTRIRNAQVRPAAIETGAVGPTLLKEDAHRMDNVDRAHFHPSGVQQSDASVSLQ